MGSVSADELRKNNVATGEARREVGVVAAYQDFPSDFQLNRVGSIEAEGNYFHIFSCYLREVRRWRTLVFSNNGNYLGYYENFDPPSALDGNCLVFPGPEHSAEQGDYEEGEIDSGDAHYIRFGSAGPPDEVKFENKVYAFVSSPNRIRPEDPAYRFVQVSDRIVNAINYSRFERVRDDFSPQALRRIPKERTEAILSGIRDMLGKIEHVGAPWVQSSDTAVLPVTFRNAVAGLKLMLDANDEIDGMWVLPFETAFPDRGENTTQLSLPFRGRWRLLWGGSSRESSKYFGDRACHHALEFIVANRFGKTCRNDGEKNVDYYAFGQPVLSPADGTVVAVVEGVEDNRPHAPNPFDRLGNAVMIQHATNEFSVIGHLMFESIVVKAGDRVRASQPVGRCGNSGDSSQPSIYYHLQDSPHLLAGSGYRPVFSNIYRLNQNQTEILEQHSPVRGEFIQQRNVPQKAPPPGQGPDSKSNG